MYSLGEIGHFDALPVHYGQEGGSPEYVQAAEIVSGAVGAQVNTPEEIQARIANLQAM